MEVVRPRDTLLVGAHGTDPQLKALADSLTEALADVRVIVVPNSAGFAVYRPDAKP
jgi:hypothetical protein